MENPLTDRELWRKYWENYSFSPTSNWSVFGRHIPSISVDGSFIEIGGFPGINAAYFYKYVCNNVSFLDFYVDPDIVRKIELQHGIPAGTIQTIEADFFAFKHKRLYDLVFSMGFIEHFQDTKDVIKRHQALLSERGKLLIVLPNFRGMNGLIQYLFDKENLRIHNLESMDINRLRGIAEELGLQNIRVEYSRKPMLWLEPKPGWGNKIGRLGVKALSYFIKLFPIKCKLLSPYIIISASK